MRVLPFIFLSSMIFGVYDNQVLAGSTKQSIQAEVEQALKPLRRKEGVTVTLKKRTTNMILDRERKSEGRLSYRQGKLRLEMSAPDNSLVVLDGKTIWLATTLDAEMGGKTMVAKTSARNFKKSSTLIAALLENKGLLNDFKMATRSVEGEEVHLKLAPKKKDSEIQELQLWLNPKAGRLLKVQYLDDKENETQLELGPAEKLEGDTAKLFTYKPPKEAEVTEF